MENPNTLQALIKICLAKEAYFHKPQQLRSYPLNKSIHSNAFFI